MKKKLLVLLAIIVVLAVVVAAPAGAKKPLRGHMDIALNADNSVCVLPITWFGTIDLDGKLYAMTFTYQGNVLPGKTNHYWEDWAIYGPELEPGDVDEDGVPTVCPSEEEEDVLLAGELSGVGRFANAKIVENGTVTVANAPYGDWQDRRMHADGVVEVDELGNPLGFEGTFRLN
jgi:hypothetical protein